MATDRKIESFMFQPAEWVPNNRDKPVLLYRAALPNSNGMPNQVQRHFEERGWTPQWCGVVLEFDHYHSTAHEVLGCVSGHALIRLGGPEGTVVELREGDAVLLPAGVSHAQVSATEDFLLIGAYPLGQQWDLCDDAATEEQLEGIRRLPFPPVDPVFGDGGPITLAWSNLPAADAVDGGRVLIQ
jgi:uncharacterized protein YjlB